MDITRHTLDLAEFPLLIANVYDKASGGRVDFAEPYTIIEKQGVKVGILGVVTIEPPRITRASSVAPFVFTCPIDEAKALIPEMKAAGEPWGA